MKPSKHIMLDLETMGTRPDAAIIAIGAVEFDEYGTLSEFYTTIDLESAMSYGGTVDADTIKWWMRQSDEARKLFQGANPQITTGLQRFATWLICVAAGSQEQRDDLLVWGNGADFDNVILASAYRNTRIQQPWGRFKNRCYRTIKSANRGITLERVGTHHNALDDARSQAEHLIRIWAATPSATGAPA